MYASDRLSTGVRAFALAALTLSLLSNALADTGDREQEQTRRLKQQLRQQQQEKDAAIQEAQAKASADKAALTTTLQAAQVDAQAQRRAAGMAARRVQVLESELNTVKQDKEALAQKVMQLQQSLETSQAQADRQAQQAAAELANSQSRIKTVSEHNDQCRTQNAALSELGLDLLARYERKNLIEVLSTQEPFFQTARITLENTKAQYLDKLEAARVKVVAP